MTWKNDQVSEKETEIIIETAKKCLKIPGDFVELGCYKGDTSLMLSEVIKDSDKKLYIYDSFEGLPEKSAEDKSVLGENFVEGALLVSKREVKERFLRAGLKVPVIKKAWFFELDFKDLPDKISFAFLDGDSLKLVENKMSDDGIIIVHDYNNPALPGVKKAVDEWVSTRKLQVLESCAIIS